MFILNSRHLLLEIIVFVI